MRDCLPIDVPPVPHRHDRDQLRRIVHRIHDTVVADPKTKVGRIFESLRLRRVGVVAKEPDSRADPLGHLGANRSQLTLGGPAIPDDVRQPLQRFDLGSNFLERPGRLVLSLRDQRKVQRIL